MNKSTFFLIALCSLLIAHCSLAQTTCKADFDIVKDSAITSIYAYFFEDKSTGTNIVSWTWDFGDNQTSNDSSAFHIYQNPGEYKVCLTIETLNNDCQNDSCTTLNVPPPPNCNSFFYFYNYNNDTTGLKNPALTNTYYFVDMSDGNIKNWLWDFGDGTQSTTQNPVHNFNPGSYNVCLTIYGTIIGDSLCQDTYCEPITTKKTDSCYAAFYNFPDTASNTTFQFADASTGNPNRWFWNFGDDSTSTLRNPLHKFTNPGYYNVCLTIINDSSQCKDMRCYDIYAGAIPVPCEAEFDDFPDTLEGASTTYDFVNLSKGNALKFLWNFGDGDISLESNPIYSFPHTGVFNVCLTISDSLDQVCNDIYCQTVFVGDKSSTCHALFIFSPDPFSGPNYYKFTDESTTGNFLTPSSWLWDFGDNTTDTLENPEHQYLHQGLYYPCLTISNDIIQCHNIYCSEIFIPGGNDSCHAQFTYEKTPDVVSMPGSQVYQFNDNSKGNIDLWYWEFGDGTTSNEENPSHIYYPGKYKVSLTISSNPLTESVCNDTYSNVVIVDTIVIPPISNCNNYFTDSNDPLDTLQVYFYGNSVYNTPPVNYIWTFGDGDSSFVQNPVYTYKKGGVYTVSLTTIDSVNCTFTSAQTVFVNVLQGYGNIEGQIFAGSKNADKAIVIIAGLNSSNNSFTYLDSNYVDSSGSYHFNKIPYGQYYVVSYLQPASKYYTSFLPTFYGNKWYWADATTISVTNSTPVLYYINLIPYKNTNTGTGVIKGFVSYGGIKPVKSSSSLDGVEVLLHDINDNPLNYCYTDANGLFAFKGLAFGTYKIYVEIFGVYTSVAFVTISPENPEADNIGFNVDYSILPFIVALSVNEITNVNGACIGEVFPNPLSDIANIPVYLVRQTEITLSVYNQVGQLISVESASHSAGINILHLNTSLLSKGVYYINITSKDGIQSTKKFVKIE